MQTSLLFGIHCHQPVDNFSKVVDNAIEKSYRPFFEIASKFNFKFSVHFSGWLLEYIKDNDKKLFELMQNLSQKGQIEFFTGGFYEPILANIPSRDKRTINQAFFVIIYQFFQLNNSKHQYLDRAL